MLLLSVGAGSAQASTYNGRFTCNNQWTWVANVPSGYVIGNCPGGTNLLRTSKDYGDGNYYDGGFVQDSGFNGCGWIRSDYDTQVDPNYQVTGCQSASTSVRAFMWLANCQPGACKDGTSVTIPTGQSCLEVANVRPWGSALAPSGVVAVRSAGYTALKWRYVVGQNGAPKADPYGNYWVMVHDPGNGTDYWDFVPLSCLGPLNPAAGSSYYLP